MKKQPSNAVFWFSALQFCYWTLAFITDGVYASFLKSMGYGEAFIGRTLMFTGLAGLVLLPISGYLADRLSNFRLLAAVSFVLMGGMVPVVQLLGGTPAVVYAYAVVGGGFTKVTGGMLESWMNKTAKESAALDYGRVRSVGSISYAVMAALLGAVFAKLGYGVCAPLAVLLTAAGLVGVLQLQNPKAGAAENAQNGPSVSETVRYLLGSRSYMLFLLCSLLMNITTQSFFGFFALLAEEVGGSVSTLGTAYFLLAFCEFWVVRYFTAISGKLGIARTYGLGMAGNFLKSFLHASAANVPQLYACSITQCFSFALATPGAPVYLRETVDKRYLASAQLVSSTLGTVVVFAMSGIYGTVAEAQGVRSMIRLFSLPALVGGVLFLLLANRFDNKKEQAA
ncbi:MAG: MFS transporter [Oscillospiraceae bacterium]|nr:MFS transporter [Oscillospiraceae bacterium]